jgi:hypothetical protein
MTAVVRTFYPEVRLKKLMRESGGMTVDDALKAATKNLESIREQCLEAVDRKIEEISDLAQSDQADRFETIYCRSNEVFGEAGTFGLKELSAAAHSLCSLLAKSGDNERRTKAVNVHVATMRALRHPGMAGDVKAREAVLHGLRQLTEKVSVQTAG